MTEEELKKVPFRETCHMAMEGDNNGGGNPGELEG
jgi:hypothetical protein